MTDDQTAPEDAPVSPPLRLQESEISSDNPWHDDVLDRAALASSLTSIIATPGSPLVLSIHGPWGTGKTFLLKRWHKDLQNNDFRALYFNAWEDDFCDDPVLAILGQLHGNLRHGRLRELADSAVQNAIPLVKRNLSGVLTKTTGLTVEIDSMASDNRDYFKEYLAQHATKAELRKSLERLTCQVVQETGNPLVFIIDELDRCRPTFAIDLLERVKHIFDVPGLVFVFGINRDELCTSLESIYGPIDSTVYLRRFFDLEFTLPNVDSEAFAKFLLDRYELSSLFISLSNQTQNRTHQDQYRLLTEVCPPLWKGLGMSLRDIDYCIRLISLAGMKIGPGQDMFAELLGLLVSIKHSNLRLYRRFIQGEAHSSEILDYLDDTIPSEGRDVSLNWVLDEIEASLYMVDGRVGDASPVQQLKLLASGNQLTREDCISKRAAGSGAGGARALLQRIGQRQTRRWNPMLDVVGFVARLIDLNQDLMSR